VSIQDPLYPTRSGAAALEVRPLGLRWPSLSSLAAQLGLAGVVATTLLICAAAAHTSALLPQTIRAAPAGLDGAFAGTRFTLGPGGLITALALMFLCYVAAVAGAQRLSPRILVTGVIALHALVLLAPPLFSTDMFSYQAYARMGALYGANPYLLGPHAVAHDPIYALVGFRWTHTPTVYGPLFTTLSYAFAPLSVAASAFAYKAVAAGASLLSLWLVWRIARLRGIDPWPAVALVGLNPLLVLYGVGGGHNDLLMLLPLLAGIYLVLVRRPGAGAAMMVTAAAIKVTGGLALGFAMAAGGREATEPRKRLLAGAGTALAAFAVLALAAFGTGTLHLPAALHQVQSQGAWQSLAGLAVKGLGLESFQSQISTGLGVVCALVLAWLLRRVWCGRMDWVAAAGWGAAAVLLTASSILPWYAAWLLPLAALGGQRRLWRVSVLLTAAILAGHVVDYLPHPGITWSP
jgi:alpha-1,6-mannosyltransferase